MLKVKHEIPTSDDIVWFAKNVSPRNLFDPKIMWAGGKGWKFYIENGEWYLELKDEKMYSLYMLMRDNR